MMTTLAAENPLIPPLPEIIIGLIAIALVFGLLIKFVWPQFEKAYAARTEAIEGGIKRAEDAQREAKVALERYNEQLAGARSEAGQIREEARAEGQRIIDEMKQQAQAESQRIVTRGEEQLVVQRQQVVSELRQQVGQVSVSLASRIVGENLQDDAKARSTVDQFLNELDGMSARSGAQQ